MFLGIVAAQVLALSAALCMDGATASCSMANCTKAWKECDGGYWGPCTCYQTGPGCSDGNPCTADEATPSGCVHSPTPGLVCSDGNACTTGDLCNSYGACGGTPAIGQSCSDGNACTTADACTSSATCVGRTLTASELNDANPCTDDSCDPAIGVKHLPGPAGRSCADGSVCNGTEVCNSAGQCLAGASLVVDDGNSCTTDWCDPVSGVQHSPALGQVCSDGNACTGSDACTSTATCVGSPLTAAQIDDHNSCTVDSCDPVIGVRHVPGPGGLCSDGNVCNGLEACDTGGQCVAGSSPLLDDGDPCTGDSCDPALGVRHTPVASCGPPGAGAMPSVAGNPLAQEIPQAPSAGGPIVVEHLGELGYQYGFELPAARGRYQPTLGLAYSSSNTQDEGLGVGWSISMSYVESDILGIPRSSDGTSPERYWLSMEGARKLLVVRGNGKYQPEVIASWMELSKAADKWTGADAVGNAYEFAQFFAGPSGKGGRWYLTKVVDVDGNQTLFTYLRDGSGAAANVQTIKYNVYSGGTLYATQILLTYATKGPARYVPVAGTISDRSMYLDRLFVQNLNGGSYATTTGYAISYDTMREGVRVLGSIARFGTNTAVTLPPTTFTYAVSVSSGYSLNDGQSFDDPATGVTNRAWVDMDGDSFPDRVWRASTPSGLWWARNTTPPGSSTLALGTPVFISGSEGATWIETYPEQAATSYTQEALRDLDGDGISDLITANSDYSLTVRFGVITEGAPSFSGTVQISLPESLRTAYAAAWWGGGFALDVSKSQYGGTAFQFRTMDVNGDGALDFAFREGCRAFLGYLDASGNRAFSNEVVLSAGGTCGLDDDANADGLLDLLLGNGQAKFGEGRSISAIFEIPWNPAIGTLEIPTQWYQCPAPGETQPAGSLCEDPDYPDHRQRKALADLDGDGHLDTLYKTIPNERLAGDASPLCLAEPCPIAVYWGSPSGQVARSVLQMPDGGVANLYPAAEPLPWGVKCLCYDVFEGNFTGTRKGTKLEPGWEEEFIDLNGDGVLDHVVVDNGINRFYEGTNGTNGRPAVLQAVITPTGARYDVTYAPATQFGANFRDVSPSVVTSIVVSQPESQTPRVAKNTTYYWYATGVGTTLWFEPHRREPRGFTQTWAQQEEGRVVRSTTWATSSHALTGSPLLIEWGTPRNGETLPSGAPGSDVFRRVTYGYQVRKVGSSTCYEQSSEPPPSGYSVIPVTTYFRLAHVVGASTLTSERTTLCTDVDDYGNTLRIKSDPDITNAADEYYEHARFDASAACKSCVVETKKSRDFEGSSSNWLRRSVYRYDSPAGTADSPLPEMRAGNGHLNYVARWAVDSSAAGGYEIESFTAYHQNGNITVRTVGSVWELYQYDEQALRVVRKMRWEPHGTTTLEIVSSYDPITGWITSEEGPYLSGSNSPRSVQAYAYDSFGRVIATGRSVSNGVVTGALSATEYVDSAPPVVRSYVFASPLTITAGAAIPVRPDVKQSISFMDGLGRVVQVRERLGVAGSTDPGVSGIGTQIGSGYRVTKSVQIDRAGRVVGSLEPYHSETAAYEPLDNAKGSGRRGARSWFDARGWVTCTATGVYEALEDDEGACTSSFADDAGYRLSTAYRYRGVYRSPRHFVGVEVVPPGEGSITGTETVYAPAGRVDRTTDAYGNEFLYAYDTLGQRTSVTRRASGGVVTQVASFEYDTVGRLISDYDPNWSGYYWPSRLYSYDPQGRVTRVLMPIREVAPGQHSRPEILYEYASLGRLTRVYAKEPSYDPRSGVTMIERTISTTAYDRPYANLSAYEYTAGQVASITSPNATVAFGYDVNGVPVRRDQWFTGVTGAFTSTAVTSNDGRMLSTTFASQHSKTLTTTYRYDTMLRPTTIDVGGIRAWEVTGYDALDRVRDVHSNAGTVLTHREYGAYDGQLKLHTVGTTASQVYGVDNLLYLGGKLKAARDPNTSTDYSYNYDANGRLLRAAAIPSASGPLTQTYDERYGFSVPSWLANASMGNLERVSRYGADGSVVVRDNDYTDDRLTASWVGGVAVAEYDHDLSGRVARATDDAGTRSYGYDVEGHLTALLPSSGTGEVLEYDPTGQLMFRKVGTKVTYYVGELATVTGDVPAECSGYGCAAVNLKVAVHVQLAGARVATARVPAPGDPTLPESDVLYYHRDRAGSVIATTLTGGRVGEKYRYLPYGGVDRVEVVTGNAQSELGYTGALRLSGSLLHLNARVYDTASGRFLQPDVVDALRYTYAAGDPVGLVDPSGMLPIDRGREYFSEAIPMPGLLGAFQPDVAWYARVAKREDIRAGNPELYSNAVQFFGSTEAVTNFVKSIPRAEAKKVEAGSGVMQIRGAADGALTVGDDRGVWVVAPDGSPAGYEQRQTIRAGAEYDASAGLVLGGMTVTFDSGVYSSEVAYSQRVTKEFFFAWPTKLARSATGMITGGAVARSFGTVPLGELYKSIARSGLGPPGIATLGGVGGAAIAFGLHAVANGLVAGTSLYVGVAVGSRLFGAWQATHVYRGVP